MPAISMKQKNVISWDCWKVWNSGSPEMFLVESPGCYCSKLINRNNSSPYRTLANTVKLTGDCQLGHFVGVRRPLTNNSSSVGVGSPFLIVGNDSVMQYPCYLINNYLLTSNYWL
ncbi:unnamed protein product [Allacma fusca]|uniref:Uncharacterized protein n=1 Tax=Allacma fusca TaxID=39272 RepID=A0A8J2KV06_9HEXA|nr:unnamed protein product [Allacma fusca]